MQIEKPLRRLLPYALAIAALAPLEVYARTTVTKERLDDWFFSWLAWGAAIGAIVGIVVGLFYLCRLPFEHKSLNVNRQARKRFWVLLLVIFILGGVLLLVDAWLIHDFGPISLELVEVLSQVWWNYRTLAVLGATLGMFTVAVALTTRLKRDCHCRYAFLRGPRT